MVTEFIVPLEEQIISEQEKKQVVEEEKETQEIVGQKRRASSASTEMVAAAGGTRRSKRVKVAPTRYVPVVEEVSLESSPRDSSGVLIRNTALPASPPLDHSSATTDETTMNVSNEDTNTDSSQRVSAVAAATMVHNRRNVRKTFDERFKDLISFKAELGHCNVPNTNSRNNKYRSLGNWCSDIRRSYKSIKEGGKPKCKLSKADIQRLENAGFEWNLFYKPFTFDERFKDLMAFKAKFGHCKVPCTQSSTNKKYHSLGMWCSHVRTSYKSIKEGGKPKCKLSKADIQRLENAGFEWNLLKTFDERFKDLMAFKAKFGHCNVPLTKSNKSSCTHYSLGIWCSNMRQTYKAIKEGRGKLGCKISKADIKRLEKAGFKWRFLK